MHNSDLALVEHSARAVNTILDAIYKRKRSPSPAEPVSDCCNAAFERVMKDLLVCSACGRICSDGSLSI
jgi:hypothetical protein